MSMHMFRFVSPSGARLGLNVDGESYDLSTMGSEFVNLSSWLSSADPIAAVLKALPRLKNFKIPEQIELLAPVDEQEVWACGVTYLRSKVARMEESDQGGDFYDQVYEAPRPEIFFKASPSRVVGPGQPIRIRRDSTWNVPEPELALVLSSSGVIVGYTIGN